MARDNGQHREANVIYLRGKDLRALLYGNDIIPTTIKLSRARGTVTGELLRWRQAWPTLYFTDDGGPIYRRNAFSKAVELIEKEGITHLFSSFRPWSDHLIAARLKKRFPNLYWIADFRDLPVDSVRKDIGWPAVQRRFLHNQIKLADVVTAVSEGQARQLSVFHSRVHVLRNGIFRLPPPFPTMGNTSKFTIRYTGSIYRSLQDPSPVFRVLRQLIDQGKMNPFHLRLEFFGNDPEAWRSWTSEHGLSHLSEEFPPRKLDQLLEAQQGSQINLLLTWSGPGYYGVLTAKLYDYLQAGRPILAFVNGPEDPELRDIVEGCRAGKVFHQNSCAGAIEAWLLDLYRTWTFTGGLPWLMDRSALEAYTWRAQVASLAKVLML